jgi:hypothetical protein
MAESESESQAVSMPVSNFYIGSRRWKTGDPIHSLGAVACNTAVDKKKMHKSFGVKYATTRVEGVFLGRGDGKKYRVKWIKPKDEIVEVVLVCDYGADHSIFKDPSTMASLSNILRKYDNGSYLGEFSGGEVGRSKRCAQRHGHGTHYFDNGDVYDGSWVEDKIEGQGIYKWPNGTKYEGYFSAGLMNGQGKFSWPDGRKYEGLFKNGKQI